MTTLTNATYLKILPFAAQLFSFLSFSLSSSCFSSSFFPPFLEVDGKKKLGLFQTILGVEKISILNKKI